MISLLKVWYEADTVGLVSRHQKEALYFITQREAAIVDDEFSLWKSHENESGSH